MSDTSRSKTKSKEKKKTTKETKDKDASKEKKGKDELNKSKKSKDKDKDKDKRSSKKKTTKKAEKEIINLTTNKEAQNLSGADITDEIFKNDPKSPKNMNFNDFNNKIKGKYYPVEKCEGCFDLDGNCFCVNCEKIFCKTCEDQIHIIPIYKTHERVPISEIHHLKKLCYHHNQSLKFFCESCEEPICQDCHKIGPHNNKLHRIMNVIESFRKKFTYVTQLVNQNLADKLNILINQIQFVENNMDDVKKTKNEIERDVRMEYSRIIENLRSEEGKKMAVLQHESSSIQKEIDKINDIVETVKEISFNESPDMIGFLLKFKPLVENIEICLTKPIRNTDVISVPTNDFTREVEERKKIFEEHKKIKDLVKYKDEIIWGLVARCNGIRTDNNILSTGKLNSFVCHFCGIGLDEFSVNSLCSKNDGKSSPGNYCSNVNMSQEIVNNKRHYFAQSAMNANKAFKNLTMNYENVSDDFIFKIFSKMQKSASKNGINLENLITDNFKVNNTIKEIKPVLTSKLELSEQEASTLLMFFAFDTKNNSSDGTQVNVNGMLNFLKKSVGKGGRGEGTPNPFENNILNEQRQNNTRYGLQDEDGWMFSIAMKYNSMQLEKHLTNYESAEVRGAITYKGLAKAFEALGINVQYEEIDDVVAQLNINTSEDFVNVKEFARAFINKFS